MMIGYARTSTADQEAGLEAQERDLRTAGCDRVFSEQVSATAAKRPQLAAALEFLRQGDVLAVTKPDRLARSTLDLLGIVQSLEMRGIGLLVLSMGGTPLDTRNPTSKLTLQILAAIAEFEKALMKERQAEGIAAAKRAGRYRGRKPTAMAQTETIKKLKAEGFGATEIARQLGVGRASVHRALKIKAY